MIGLPCSSNYYIQSVEFSSATIKTTALRACYHTYYYRSSAD